MFDFDSIIDRHTPGDIKYQAVEGASDLIPMWVADMDFKTAPCVERAVREVAERGVYGYQDIDSEYLGLVRSWYGSRFSFDISDEWIVPSPAVMYSVACAIRALTSEGDSVLIFEPVYYPFSNVVKSNRRQLVVSDLKNTGGHYEIDFDDFESKLKDNDVKAVLFCSPHNPVGRVWTREELGRLADICLSRGVYIISDEIHSDLVFEPYRHIPIASLSEDTAALTVTCVAPTKTFNLASIQASNIIIPDARIRRAVRREMLANCHLGLNAFGIAATKAVYSEGGEWLTELLSYLDKSREILSSAFAEYDGISVAKPQGTYLAWLDCRGTGLTDDALYDRLIGGGVRLHKGGTFGSSGKGFMRLNFACPHSVLEEAIDRIKGALSDERSV